METLNKAAPGPQEAVERRADAAASPVLLLASDGSASSWHASERAVVLAGLLRARLVVLYAVDVHAAFREGIHYGEAVRTLEREGQQVTGEVAALAGERGVECEVFMAEGRPADAILGAAERLEVDYVLMGVRGRSRAGQILLGSVSQQVLLRAERTVLLVGGRRAPDDPMLDRLSPLAHGLVGEGGAPG